MTTLAPDNTVGKPARSQGRVAPSRLLGGIMEAWVLLLTCASPWLLGASEPVFEFLLYAGVGVLLTLWGARAVLDGRLHWARCPVALCLGGLLALGLLQLVPLPKVVLERIAPGTAAAYGRLLPSEAELPSFDERLLPGPSPAGRTLSLYPGATRREVVRLLAVLLLFLAVRNTAGSASWLRRLSWAAFINGVFLSAYGLMQYLPEHDVHTIFGTIRVQGRAFGPFQYRNYYACYVNMSIGFGLGLLLSSLAPRREGGSRACLPERFEARGRSGPGTAVVRRLLIGCGLALLVGCQLICQSRGGLLALGLTAFVLAPLWEKHVRKRHLAWLGGAAVVVLAAAAFLEYRSAGSRLLNEDLREEGRFEIWSRVLPLAKDFPVWGTGNGTFQFVEQPLQRRADYHVVDYAHNEYLEALIEGGVLRLALSLAAVVFVVRCGLRAIRRSPGDGRGRLATGTLFAVTTLFVHSFGDFVLHLPSIVVLGTVACATLCGLGRAAGRGARGAPGRAGQDEERDGYSLRVGGVAPLVGVAAAVALGLVLSWEGWKAYRAQHLLLAAMGVGEPGRETTPESKIARLQEATEVLPSSARLHVLLGDAQLEYYEARVAECASEFGKERAERLAGRLAPAYLSPALRHYLEARNLCPLMAKPHARIAACRQWFTRADAAEAYLDRARSLVPCDAELWYCCAVEELKRGDKRAACMSWRRCLELVAGGKDRRALQLSDRYVRDILAASSGVLSPREVADGVLVEDRHQLLTAMTCLGQARGARDIADLSPCYEKALAAYSDESRPLQASDYADRARIHRSMGRLEEALADYRAALERDPSEVGWRYEAAELLCRQGKRDEAEDELLLLLRQKPNHGEAKRLLHAIRVEKGVEK
jgi:O-antigen ligase/tetratricopeptide (TPR) repeat protein